MFTQPDSKVLPGQQQSKLCVASERRARTSDALWTWAAVQGQLMAALTDAGFDTTGIDTSAEVLSLARRRAPKGHFVLGSAYDVELKGYDAIVALGEPLTP